MKIIKLGLLLSLSIPAQAQTFSVKAGGNGAGAFVCRDSNNQIISAELVDLYEGRNKYQLQIPESNASVEDLVNRAFFKYSSASSNQSDFLQAIQHVKRNINKLNNVSLASTDDFDLQIQPSSCAGGTIKFEQLANYNEEGLILVNNDIYSKLSNVGKAATIVHEATYALARTWHDVISSVEARRLTAYLFSTLDADAIDDEILNLDPIDPSSNKIWLCGASYVFFQVEFGESTDGRYGYQYNGGFEINHTFEATGSTLDRVHEKLEEMIENHDDKMKERWSFYHDRKTVKGVCSPNFSISYVLNRNPQSVLSCRSWTKANDCKKL